MISAEISPVAVDDAAASGFEAGGGAMICTLMTSAADTDALRDRAAGRAATGSFADKS